MDQKTHFWHTSDTEKGVNKSVRASELSMIIDVKYLSCITTPFKIYICKARKMAFETSENFLNKKETHNQDLL